MRRIAALGMVGAVGAVGLVGVLAACGGGHGSRTAGGESAPSGGTQASTSGRPTLAGPHPCPGVPGFTCASLAVPLDHAGETSGTLRLSVGYATRAAAPRGVLLFLTGGPGQPGVPLIPRIDSKLRAAMRGYRLVMFDQRGTGAGALRCPALQAAAGSSDLAIVPPGTVAGCARRIGPDRRYYTTSESVADIDTLRRAFGVRTITLDGVSYGTFVAERYALAHPGAVARLVLDSVVPQQGVDPLYRASLTASGRVLRSACAEQHCGADPARDLAAAIRATPSLGPAVLNALAAESIVYPSFRGIPAAIHAAAAGRPGPLHRVIAAVDAGEAAPAAFLSQGLHESTLCLDLLAPYDPRRSTAARAATIGRMARLPASAFYPFDRSTAIGNGIAKGCLAWPPTTPPALPTGNVLGPLPPVPVLLLSGERDLSTPLAWAREEASHAPDGQLLTVAGAGHSVQLRAREPSVLRSLARFLAG
jgi:pimeloyl-ACP methyl ester carboxylesterase